MYFAKRATDGIKEDEIKNEQDSGLILGLSPNPVKTVTNVSSYLPIDGELIIELHDITGQNVYKAIFQKEKGEHTELIDLSRLTISSGVYILTPELNKVIKLYTKV